MKLRLLLAMVAVSFAASCTVQPAAEMNSPGTRRNTGTMTAAIKSGWYIRVCKMQTEASAIDLEVGLGGNEGSHRAWRRWNSTDPAEIDLPEDLRNVKEIWIKGTAVPSGRNVHMCALYVDHVTKRMTFDGDEEHETSQTDSDDCGC